MTDLLLLMTRVTNAISLGEGHFREFKSAFNQTPGDHRPRKVTDICTDIARTLVAFANADGGDLLVGVEDDGRITGVPHTAEQVQALLNAPITHVMNGEHLGLQHKSLIQIGSEHVLLFSVSKGSGRIFQTIDGRTVKRDGLQTVPIHAETLLFEQRERASRTFDSEFVDGAEVSSLDLDLLRGMAARYIPGMTPELYLQQLGLAEYAAGGLRLRRAALLLFARDILEWHPRSQVRILRVMGHELKQGVDYNVLSQETVTGNLLTLQASAWEALRPFLSQSATLGSDARFQQRYLYPELACREALINAITHRDYTIHNSVDVFVYDDRMEISSPGRLLSTVRVEDLTRLNGVHESRNSLVAKCLREAGYVQELGEGMRRIFRLMEENALRQPELTNAATTFSVTLFHRSVFTEQQSAWLRLFDEWHLSQLQQRIVVAGIGGHELSPEDIYEAINTHDRDTYDREVTFLRRNGLLLETLRADQATSRARATGKSKGGIKRFVIANPLTTPPSGRIVIHHIPRDITEKDLENSLGRHGKVVYVQLSKRAGRTARGIAIMSDPRVVDRLLASGGVISVREHRLTVQRPAQYVAEDASPNGS
ncbi:ATP-binding protein [Cellulomonas marina]|uniref:ATP-dependent DNA helicase RecG n=1 Tax=Cellulomonas marina TaxID=988821 RepID=A0A1I0XBM3_9CELL|nr:ATP-binding protein [Cellulomonas marina]SFA97678.1 ATP-dependent DNA helicase RecG [Cellulomonas marina]